MFRLVFLIDFNAGRLEESYIGLLGQNCSRRMSNPSRDLFTELVFEMKSTPSMPHESETKTAASTNPSLNFQIADQKQMTVASGSLASLGENVKKVIWREKLR